ncbi:MAG: MFS transporter [Christensenellales bacterium]|jgi:UMF1 family MFS transporter
MSKSLSNTDKFTKAEKSWILYDWANSVYATNIMAAIFPTIFVSIAGESGDLWWGYATSIATFIIAVLAPILGAFADYKGVKKKLFTAFMLLGVVSTLSLSFTNDWRIMLVIYAISRIGFNGSNLFYDSFLTDVTTNERMDKVSSWGYAMGYIGGSTIPFIASIIVLIKLGYSNPVAQKFSIIITSVWWLVFSIPFLKNVEHMHYKDTGERPSIRRIFTNVGNTFKDIMNEQGMMLFIIAYFFYIDGVGTIISVSTAYGAALGLGAVGMILALLVTQIVAMPCSILFPKLAKKISTRRSLMFAIAVYMFICVVGFLMGYTLEPHQASYNSVYDTHMEQAIDNLSVQFEDEALADKAIKNYMLSSRPLIRDKKDEELNSLKLSWEGISESDSEKALIAQKELYSSNIAFAQENKDTIDDYYAAQRKSSVLFWAMAILVGTVQGGIQATSRSYFGKLIPKNRSNEFFGFFDIFGKFASVIGPLLYSFVAGITGRSSYGTLCLLVLFIIGFVILKGAKKPLEELEMSRAKQEA